MNMGEGKLTIFNHNGKLFAEVQRSKGRLYLLKLSIMDQGMFSEKKNLRIGFGTPDLDT